MTERVTEWFREGINSEEVIMLLMDVPISTAHFIPRCQKHSFVKKYGIDAI